MNTQQLTKNKQGKIYHNTFC